MSLPNSACTSRALPNDCCAQMAHGGFVDFEQPDNLVAEHLETAKDVTVARNDTAAALLDIAQAPEPIVFEVEEPVGVVERLLSPRRDDRLYAGKCHSADMTRPAVFVQSGARRRRRQAPAAVVANRAQKPGIAINLATTCSSGSAKACPGLDPGRAPLDCQTRSIPRRKERSSARCMPAIPMVTGNPFGAA